MIMEPIHTLQMQYHCMQINKTTINAVKPRQTPVDVSEQPMQAFDQ